MTLRLAIIAAALGLAATSADAQTFSRSGPGGGSVNGVFSSDGYTNTRDATRVGPNGGVFNSTRTCGVGGRVCGSNFDYTTPEGDVYTGRTGSARGPFRGRGAAEVTSPDGTTTRRVRGWRR